MSDIVSYYDSMASSFVEDMRIGNKRVVMALDFAREHLSDCRWILDVGCGIGWTSSVLAEQGRSVRGLDISPALIAQAQRMFGYKCRFEVADFITWSPVRTFEGVLMVDVYEHFPMRLRHYVYNQLEAINPTKIVLTVPTPEAQRYAIDNGISLQPVDEFVTDFDLQELARAVHGELEINRKVSVWRPDDYRHVLIRR